MLALQWLRAIAMQSRRAMTQNLKDFPPERVEFTTMAKFSHATLAYAPPPPRRRKRRVIAWLIALPPVALVMFIALGLSANLYASSKYGGLRPGITRAQAERHLWAFARHPNPRYNGAGPGGFAIRYEFLWFGKSSSIQIVYNANGTVGDPQPILTTDLP
jgi:hypothetical protein